MSLLLVLFFNSDLWNVKTIGYLLGWEEWLCHLDLNYYCITIRGFCMKTALCSHFWRERSAHCSAIFWIQPFFGNEHQQPPFETGWDYPFGDLQRWKVKLRLDPHNQCPLFHGNIWPGPVHSLTLPVHLGRHLSTRSLTWRNHMMLAESPHLRGSSREVNLIELVLWANKCYLV